VQPLRAAVALAGLAMTAVVVLLVLMPIAPSAVRAAASRIGAAADSKDVSAADLRVVVTPPEYTERRVEQFVNPATVTVIEGSRLRLEVALPDAPGGTVSLVGLDGSSTPFERATGRAVLDLPATSSRPLLIRQLRGEGSADRLVQLRVEPDQRPSVTFREPAKDLMFATGAGLVPVQIEARDDVGLQSLTLRYTRVSGSGETFTFEEGEWPIEIVRGAAGSWQGRAVFSLEKLALQDGDTLVYRAVARDTKPGADPATSDTYLIEIGRLAGVASQGFALPDERERQAISQQMLIIKTERLHADKSKLSAAAFLEQAQLLAIEQRMVKAEFVFMTGGEVADEVEEATHAHELAEGRLENAAQVELLNAIREMSRAEARLNAADTVQALQFERAALKALQRAFDRRRYLLRTLPERARIDVTRRLTGDLDMARSSSIPAEPSAADPLVAEAKTVLANLGDASDGRVSLSAVGARLLALDPRSETLQRAALGLTAATGDSARAAAALDAQRAVIEWLRARMTSHAPAALQREPLKGRLVQELSRGATPR
jgi:hypothetical protein